MIKNTFLFIAIALFTACQTDSSGTKANASIISESEDSTIKPLAKAEIVHVPASVLAPMIGLWQYQIVVGIKDIKTKDAYLGRWIELKGDQTFISGIWEEQTNAGKWAFNAETAIINFDYNQPEPIFDEFEVQGVGRDIVVFKGNTPRTDSGIQIKMVKDNVRPVQ